MAQSTRSRFPRIAFYKMKILLQDTNTGLYRSRGGGWTNEPHAALAFLDEIRAKDFGIYHRLSGARVVTIAEPGASDTCPPALAISANPDPERDLIMSTNKNTTPVKLQTEAKRATPKPARRTSAARKRRERTGTQTAAKPSDGKPSCAQEAARPETITLVEARIDVGLGNALFIRGQGDGLSWDKGQPLDCVGAATWIWKTAQARDKVVFKLLLNDVLWAQGEDLVLEAGRKLEVVPSF